jgi:hypothetical protein
MFHKPPVKNGSSSLFLLEDTENRDIVNFVWSAGPPYRDQPKQFSGNHPEYRKIQELFYEDH